MVVSVALARVREKGAFGMGATGYVFTELVTVHYLSM